MRQALLLIALLAPSVAVGQDRSGTAPQMEAITLVSYTLTTMLVSGASGPTAELPTALLTRLDAQSALEQLDVQGQMLTVRFRFGSVERFAAWRAAAETTALLRDLDALSPSIVQAATSLRRSYGVVDQE